jgi:lipopolysaccharide transport system ATP-binding protein
MSPSSEIIHPSSDLDEDVLIKVDNVSKKFCRDFKKSLWYGLKDTAADILHPTHKSQNSKLRPSEFWANQNISFEVKRGECLGLIGHNGAGKTTLLKMLNGLIKPDSGSIEMHGRVSALIALGAGFNPILTGRENVYVNGSILGLGKKEINAKLDEIVDFAEIDDAIDAPVRTYSSGMQVRLGFAVAAILVQPDVLILDEVLAVGDMSFTIKCLNVVRQLADRSAVVFVSHNVQMVSQFCSDIMLLKNGQVQILTSNVSKGIEAYLSAREHTVQLSGSGEVEVGDEVLWTTTMGEIQTPRSINTDESIGVTLSFSTSETANLAQLIIGLKDNSGRPVATIYPENNSGDILELPTGKHRYKFEIGVLGLTPGKYHFSAIVRGINSGRVYVLKDGILPFTVADIGNRGHVYAPLLRTAKAQIVDA